jgi:hypothetical protein
MRRTALKEPSTVTCRQVSSWLSSPSSLLPSLPSIQAECDNGDNEVNNRSSKLRFAILKCSRTAMALHSETVLHRRGHVTSSKQFLD